MFEKEISCNKHVSTKETIITDENQQRRANVREVGGKKIKPINKHGTAMIAKEEMFLEILTKEADN